MGAAAPRKGSSMNESWSCGPGLMVTVFSRGIVRQRWRFHVQDVGNGKILASSENYARRIDAMSTAERLFPRVEDGDA